MQMGDDGMWEMGTCGWEVDEMETKNGDVEEWRGLLPVIK